jgi:hypothetical protein
MSRDQISWLIEVCFFAARAATWAGETLAVSKNVATSQTLCWLDNEFLLQYCYRTGNMGQMVINFFLANSERLGKFPGAHLFLGKQRDHLLSDCFHKVVD